MSNSDNLEFDPDKSLTYMSETRDESLEGLDGSTVLVVDDQKSVRRAMKRRIEDIGGTVLMAENGSQAIETLQDREVDLMLLDIGLPDIDGFEVLETLRDQISLSQLPVIMVTGRQDDDDIVQSLELGANDYVTKDTDFEITLARIRTQLKLKRATDHIRRLSLTDNLTGLLNRRAFFERLDQEEQRFRRHGHSYGLVMFDIDYFKEINDTYGHDAGDAVLEELADRLRENLREVDVPARFGGEEFIVLLPESSREGTKKVAEKLREAIKSSAYRLNGQEKTVTASFGCSLREPDEEISTGELIKKADQAMYLAKENGRDRVRFFGED